jgi:hypothetical protein
MADRAIPATPQHDPDDPRDADRRCRHTEEQTHDEDADIDTPVERRRFCRYCRHRECGMDFAGLVGTVTPIVAK